MLFIPKQSTYDQNKQTVANKMRFDCINSGCKVICVAFDLTLSTEEIFRGTAPILYQKFLKEEKKGEFVVVLEGTKK